MTDISNFNWFDLSKYDRVESFGVDDWYYQLSKRRMIQNFSKENPETIKALGVET
jgi:hypothetical protein